MSDSEIAAGVWRRAGHAEATGASLMSRGDAVVVVDGGGREIADAAAAALTVSDRVGSIPRHIVFPDGSDFETMQNDAIDAFLRRQGRGSAGLIHGLERFRPRLLVFAAVTVALCFALYRYAVPLLVEVAVLVTPPAVNEAIGKSVMLSLDQLVFEPSALPEARRNVLQAEFAAMAATTPRAVAARAGGGPLPYTLNFRTSDTIGPNAFALPDGTIVITDDMITLATDDDMVLGVLAHEIGHVDRDHSLRQLYRVAGVAALIMLIGGDIGSATEDILTQGAALLALSHSRSAESEADRYSVELMHRSGRDPTAIARFFEVLHQRFGLDNTSDFFSTHPATPERIAAARRYAAELSGKPLPAP